MFKRIFALTDFSACADEALKVAVVVAQKFDSHVTLVHACTTPASAYMGMVASPLDLVAAVEDAARATLEEALASLRREHAASDSMLVFGHAASELLRAIQRSEVDLVVMGTRGRNALPQVLLGSIAERLVRLSPVPVLTVRWRR